MDYILQGSSSWTGVQLPLGTGEEYPDLSGSSALAFDCKAEGALTNVRLFIEIGSLSEDLDGDGNLDEEISEYSGGFIFNDANSDSGTLVGGDNLTETNGQLDTEDFNGNGFLDSEKSSAAVYFELTSRITSYNVCYTKLLRVRSPAHCGEAAARRFPRRLQGCLHQRAGYGARDSCRRLW